MRYHTSSIRTRLPRPNDRLSFFIRFTREIHAFPLTDVLVKSEINPFKHCPHPAFPHRPPFQPVAPLQRDRHHQQFPH